jgi:hypothetical protein
VRLRCFVAFSYVQSVYTGYTDLVVLLRGCAESAPITAHSCAMYACCTMYLQYMNYCTCRFAHSLLRDVCLLVVLVIELIAMKELNELICYY